jgi:hypothetical protein
MVGMAVSVDDVAKSQVQVRHQLRVSAMNTTH